MSSVHTHTHSYAHSHAVCSSENILESNKSLSVIFFCRFNDGYMVSFIGSLHCSFSTDFAHFIVHTQRNISRPVESKFRSWHRIKAKGHNCSLHLKLDSSFFSFKLTLFIVFILRNSDRMLINQGRRNVKWFKKKEKEKYYAKTLQSIDALR